MAGYRGYSMSNNAYDAYETGEKPASKWTKQEMLDEIYRVNPACPALIEKLRKEELFCNFFRQSSWHHTSKMYNKTGFYAVDDCRVASITEADIMALIENRQPSKKVKVEPEKEFVIVCYEEAMYSGGYTRRTRYYDAGYILGKFFYSLQEDKKKKADGKYFRIVEKGISEERARAFLADQQNKKDNLSWLLKHAKTNKKGLKHYKTITLSEEDCPKGSEFQKYISRNFYIPED